MILADLHVAPMKMAIYLLGYVMGMGQNWVLGCRLSSHHAKGTPCVAGAVTNTGNTTLLKSHYEDSFLPGFMGGAGTSII